MKHVDSNPKKFHPVIEEFRDLIEGDTRLYMMFNSMFKEIPTKKPYKNDPSGEHQQIRDYKHMLEVLNHLIVTAPEWDDKQEEKGVVGLPINALLDYPMATPSGWGVFLDEKVNAMLKKVLNVWGEFLQSSESAYCLDEKPHGWMGQSGTKTLTTVANAAGGNDASTFDQLFICDPKAPRHGFKSWDHFFTREFKPEARPIAAPEDDTIIANACESKPYNLAHNVKERDRFWVKGQPYSVTDMLHQDELAPQFTGGTIYQAFLSALSYHRWHSPVSGTIKKCYVVDGTYYSEPLFESFADPHGRDPGGQGTAQGYITSVATRAVIFIQADNEDIGLMAFLGVGMVEVSTCDITVKEGQHIKKGDQLGMVSLYSHMIYLCWNSCY